MQAKVTAGQSEGVHRAVTPHQDFPSEAFVQLSRQIAPQARRRKQGLPDVVNVFKQNRVVDVVRVAVQLPNNAIPQAALIAAGHVAAVAQVGQLGRGRSSFVFLGWRHASLRDRHCRHGQQASREPGRCPHLHESSCRKVCIGDQFQNESSGMYATISAV